MSKYRTVWEINKGGEDYTCEVSFEASSSSFTEICINQVTQVKSGLDIDPEIFQSKLTQEEEENLHKELDEYVRDYSQYVREDIIT